ncbi:MAG: hypothetical protein JSV52_04360 [Candidatus Zixiibacteriota bacterium]|nr:MAG: hypothetical protein JSV52_04360 [candidate division Zixibacteria bacterium]
MKKFKSDYSKLDLDLLNHVGDVFAVDSFTYQKDIATFTFRDGQIHLLRYVDGRPTTAIFTGDGTAVINVPSHMERMSLTSVTGDSVVNEKFDVCLIRFADDLDLKLKEQFPFEQKELKWKEFTKSKQAQNEYYFKPSLYHEYDNYFQLLRSLYERGEDGYFWIDFNRFNFCVDPNEPEPVTIAYEFEPADIIATEAVKLSLSTEAPIDDLALCELVKYPITTISKTATFEMGGIDGTKLDAATCELKLTVNTDSLKYLSTFLHYNLKEDSIHYNGQPVDYHRRNDFNFIGIILPEYVYRGDTITLNFGYHGKDYTYTLPYVEDPTPSPHSFTFSTPKGFNYLMPGMGPITETNGRQQFQVVPEQPYDKFYFQAYASGHDTVSVVSDIGITVNFLKAKHITKRLGCYVPDGLYESGIMDAFNYMTARMGNPAGTFEIFVYPENYYTMPGLVELPQILCYAQGDFDAFGGFNLFAGYSVSKQWFGNLLKPATDREFWLRDAASEYLNLIHIKNVVNNKTAYYTNLLNRRDTLYTLNGTGRDRSLGTGLRCPAMVRCNKGAWLLHMLRYLMLDLEKVSEDRFFRFFYELCMTCNATRYTTSDIVSLAEKHYGEPLDWFFSQWLSSYGYPEYDVEYRIDQKEDGYYINTSVATRGVPVDFRMPVILRVKGAGDD